MGLRIRVGCIAMLLLIAASLRADQQVTLKSGASLIGEVKIDGDSAVVTIDDSELRVPLAEVDTIASVDAGPERQAQRLLLTALEARLHNDAGHEVIGLLAEAQRLAPDDPHITFWYASSLADAGYGQAARDVLEKHREAVAKAYPGMTDQLVEKIARRVEMEKLPPALVERLDTLTAAAPNQPENNDMRQFAAMFRLVDQDEQPIDRAAFHINSNGQEENVESFDDGYFVYTFKRHRTNQDDPCTLEVAKPGLAAKTFRFSGATNRVHDAGEFVVQRYDESQKVPFRVRVIDPNKQPIAGAQVTLQPMTSRGTGSAETQSAGTGAEGHAEIVAYPMTYAYNIQAEGFNHTSGQVTLRQGDDDGEEQQHQLYRAIQATIRVAWESTLPQGGGKTSGESTLHVDGGSPRPHQHGQDPTQWLRPVQVKDRLNLQFVESPFSFGPFGPPEAWLRVIEEKSEQPETKASEAALTRYRQIDLAKIDGLKEELPQPRLAPSTQPGNPRAPKTVTTAPGKIYVGQLQHRDMRTGQPVQLSFKVLVEEMSTAGNGGESG